MEKKTIKVLGISNGNNTGVAFFRIMQPLDYLGDNSINSGIESLSLAAENVNINAEELELIDIVHIHANITSNTPLMTKLFEVRKRTGLKIVMDLDDYFIVPITNPYHEIYNYTVQPYVRHYLPLMDYITTSTSEFKGEIKKWAKKKVTVLPNWLNKEFHQFQPQEIPFNKLRIGLLCGASHEEDIKLLEGIVKQLGNYNDKIQWVIAGFDVRANVRKELSVWNYFEQVLTDDYNTLSDDYKDYLLLYDETDYPLVETQPYRRLWSKNILQYGYMYNHLDVLLAPLTNNKFNCMKSELKVVECGTFGKVFIGSDVGAYKATVTNGVNGILINNNKGVAEWVKAIKSIIDDEQLRLKLKNGVVDLINRRYNAELMNKKREEFYKSIVK